MELSRPPLVVAFELSEKRQSATDMLRYLAAHTAADAGFVAHVRQDPTVTFDEFASAAGMVFRGAGRPDYATRIERVRRILKEENGHG
jgi:hypothetical protein